MSWTILLALKLWDLLNFQEIELFKNSLCSNIRRVLKIQFLRAKKNLHTYIKYFSYHVTCYLPHACEILLLAQSSVQCILGLNVCTKHKYYAGCRSSAKQVHTYLLYIITKYIHRSITLWIPSAISEWLSDKKLSTSYQISSRVSIWETPCKSNVNKTFFIDK